VSLLAHIQHWVSHGARMSIRREFGCVCDRIPIGMTAVGNMVKWRVLRCDNLNLEGRLLTEQDPARLDALVGRACLSVGRIYLPDNPKCDNFPCP